MTFSTRQAEEKEVWKVNESVSFAERVETLILGRLQRSTPKIRK